MGSLELSGNPFALKFPDSVPSDFSRKARGSRHPIQGLPPKHPQILHERGDTDTFCFYSLVDICVHSSQAERHTIQQTGLASSGQGHCVPSSVRMRDLLYNVCPWAVGPGCRTRSSDRKAKGFPSRSDPLSLRHREPCLWAESPRHPCRAA